MITDHDMREQVKQALADEATEFNVEAIVNDIQARYGTINIDYVPDTVFWGEIVPRHAI